MELLDAIEGRSGMVCVVGAGGKKTTLYTTAAHATEAKLRAVVTATVRIPIFDREVADVQVTSDPLEAIADCNAWPLGLVAGQERDDRYDGYDRDVVDEIAASDDADVVLVKADGARTREFKAPGKREPQIPSSADVVLPIASVQAVGKPLDEETVHRPEQVRAIVDIDQGEEIRPEHIAEVIASEAGGHKDIPEEARVIPLLNKVDDDQWEQTAREIATGIHERTTVPKVVLTSMIADEPVVDVVR